jgi:hypothetical protein
VAGLIGREIELDGDVDRPGKIDNDLAPFQL